MNEDLEAAHVRVAIQHMMRRLDGFARGLGLDDRRTRQIVEQVALEMVVGTDEERIIEARALMIEASV